MAAGKPVSGATIAWMKWGVGLLLGLTLGCSGGGTPPVVAPPQAPEAVLPAAAQPAPSVPITPPAAQPPAAVVGTHVAPELRVWVATHAAGSARQTSVPAPVAAELIALAQPSYAAAEKAHLWNQSPAPLALRWVRVLARGDGSAATVAFSVGHPMVSSYGSDPAALVGFATAVVGAEQATAPAVLWATDDETRDTNDWSFEDDRDVDGDGQADQIIYSYEGRSGGGHDYSGSMIVLGSKNGSIVEIETEAKHASFESEESYSTDTVAAVNCWTRAGASHPVLLLVMTEADSYEDDGGKDAGISHQAVAADAAGTLHRPTVYAAIAGKAAAAAELVAAWRTLAGAAADEEEPAFVADTEHEPATCPGQHPAAIVPGAGTMACPGQDCEFRGDYLLLTGFAFTEADAIRLYRERTGATDTPAIFTFSAPTED